MRVLLIHAKALSSTGGAEVTLRSHVASAPAGTHIDVRLPEDQVDINDYEAVVLANLRPEGGLGTEAEALPGDLWAARLAGYRGFALRSEHDLHPCGLRDASCIQTPKFKRISCRCIDRISRAYEKLMTACHAVRFLSPGHQRVVNALAKIRVPQHVIPSPVDPVMFKPMVPWDQRPAVALLTGDTIRVAPDAHEKARTEGYAVEEIPYLSVPYDEMPTLLNRYRAVVVMPRMYHAFGRLAVEALACGCRVVANDRVGALTFEDPLREAVRANKAFWNVIQEGVETRRQHSKSI